MCSLKMLLIYTTICSLHWTWHTQFLYQHLCYCCNGIANRQIQFFHAILSFCLVWDIAIFISVYRAVAENFISSSSFWILGILFILSMHKCDLYCFFNRSLKGLFKMTIATESASVHPKYVLYCPGFRVIMRKQLPSLSYMSPALSNQAVRTVWWIFASTVLAEARCLISRGDSRKGHIFTMFPSSICGLFGRFGVKGHVKNILRVASYIVSACSYAHLLWLCKQTNTI